MSLLGMAQPLGAVAVAVSGNLLIDPPWLPDLPDQSGQALNTVIGYSEVPTVTGVSPPNGSSGETVTVTGTGFTAATEVLFGTPTGAAAATQLAIASDTQLTVTSPVGTGVVDVTVFTPAGTSATSTADQFTYNTIQ
jgi:hypothetical protein